MFTIIPRNERCFDVQMTVHCADSHLRTLLTSGLKKGVKGVARADFIQGSDQRLTIVVKDRYTEVMGDVQAKTVNYLTLFFAGHRGLPESKSLFELEE